MPSTAIQWISDALSIMTISSCLVLKVPQILTLYSLKSAEGMNMKGLSLELFSYSSMLLYNFCNGYNLLSYMEYPIILVQELVLIYFVLKYMDMLKLTNIRVCIVAYFVLFGLFTSGILPGSILTLIVPFCTPISASSKIVFLYEIVHSKKSQAVSLLTWFISAMTNASRIFTVYFDSADINLLLNFGISTLLSSSILFAAWFYKTKEEPKPKTRKE